VTTAATRPFRPVPAIRVDATQLLPRGAVRRAGDRPVRDSGGVPAAARIDDAPSGRCSILLVLDEAGDAYVPVDSLRELELAAELWGLDVAEIDTSEVGDLLT
jgi:hypothetical protein